MLAYPGHREICPQSVALSVTAGKCATLPMHRIRHHITTAMFCCQLVYNMQSKQAEISLDGRYRGAGSFERTPACLDSLV